MIRYCKIECENKSLVKLLEWESGLFVQIVKLNIE